MNTSTASIAHAVGVDVGDDALVVHLEDGRTITTPLAWFPRLQAATKEQRLRWRFIGRGIGIHWEDLDEDISVQHLLAPGHATAGSVADAAP